MIPDLAEQRALAEAMADTARTIALRHFRRRFTVETKADASPVTEADRGIERALRAMLAERRPDDGVFGEEEGADRAERRRVWVIDPIDGTKAFVTGLPLFVTLIALLDGRRPVLGLIDAPALGERWVGGDGPTTLNGSPCRTSGRSTLDGASLYSTTAAASRGAEAAAFGRLGGAVGLLRHGGDGYAYGLVASGHVDLVADAGMKPYDYLALVPVIEGAGGRVTDWRGEVLGLASDGRVLAAATPALHAAALARLVGQAGA